MKLRRRPSEGYFFPLAPVAAGRRISVMASPDLVSWANTTMVTLWQAVEHVDFEESKAQLGVLNDILAELERREAPLY